VRLFIYGNRKTTAPARLEVGSSPVTGRNQLGAGNDNSTPEVFLAIITGSVTLQEGGEFTVSATLHGSVGATGNIVIITRILARAQLRMEDDVGVVRIYERGVAEYAGMAVLVPIPGGVTSVGHFFSMRDVLDRHIRWVVFTVRGTTVMALDFRIPIVTPIHFSVEYSNDAFFGESFLEWVQVVVWG
jgi:hypothetical protein